MSRRKQLLHVGGWLVLLALAAVALARAVAWDSRSTLVGLNAVTPLLYLPAWAVAVFAGVSRRWALLAGAAVLVAAHLSFVLPEVLAAEAVPSAARSAPSMRVFDANVYEGNDDAAGYAAEIIRSRPDVVLLQEASPTFLARLDATGVLHDLPHRITVSRTGPFAAAMASRWPLGDGDIVSLRGRPILIRATVDLGGTPIRLFGFHAVAPVGGTREEWMADLKALAAAVAEEPRPVLVAGDFNATWDHQSFLRLLDEGLTDAAAARGSPWQMTWPRDRRILPAVARIDHVLTTEGLTVTRISTGTGRGSDHRPLVADVALT